jgi:hypothetical protein
MTMTELMRSGQDAIVQAGGPSLPGLIQLSTAVIILMILILRPQGIMNGRELRLPILRSAR